MPIRFATRRDLPAIAETFAAAFRDEELHVYFFPHHKEYPEDHARAWYQVLLVRWWNYDHTWLVSYGDNSSKNDQSISGDEVDSAVKRDDASITGAAIWVRNVAQPGILRSVWTWIDPRGYIAPVVSWYLKLHRWWWPNRAIGRPSANDPDPIRKWDFGRVMFPFCKRFFDQPSAKQGFWELELLGVHPKQQKRGLATELIDWGIRRAEEDKLPAVVTMAPGLEDFYAKHGFKVLVGYAPNEDMVLREKDADGKMVERTIVNPLKMRNIGGGGVAWTRTDDPL